MTARLLYTVPDAADQLSISARSLERLIKEGEVDSIKIKRGRRVPHEALTAYINKLKDAS